MTPPPRPDSEHYLCVPLPPRLTAELHGILRDLGAVDAALLANMEPRIRALLGGCIACGMALPRGQN